MIVDCVADYRELPADHGWRHYAIVNGRHCWYVGHKPDFKSAPAPNARRSYALQLAPSEHPSERPSPHPARSYAMQFAPPVAAVTLIPPAPPTPTRELLEPAPAPLQEVVAVRGDRLAPAHAPSTAPSGGRLAILAVAIGMFLILVGIVRMRQSRYSIRFGGS
jgi:hypothetical protein